MAEAGGKRVEALAPLARAHPAGQRPRAWTGLLCPPGWPSPGDRAQAADHVMGQASVPPGWTGQLPLEGPLAVSTDSPAAWSLTGSENFLKYLKASALLKRTFFI